MDRSSNYKPEKNSGTTGEGLPASPRVPMEYLSRSWSASALEVSKTLSPHISTLLIKPPPPPPPPPPTTTTTTTTITSSSSITTVDSEETDHHHHHHHHHLHHSNTISRNPLFSSQRVLDRIMSQSSQPRQQQDSPLTSGRPSLSSDPTASADSPTIVSSPPQDFYDVVKFLRSNNTPPQPQFTGGRIATVSSGGGGNKTVGRWLKDRKEKKREEARAHNAQLHAAISVAGVAAAVAAIAAATAASSGSGKEENMGETTDTAVASAATLVAAQCVEAAEAMGAERDHLVSVINSAVNVHSYDDIVTLTAAAATALRGAATLKVRALKEVRNAAAAETLALPVPKARGRTSNPNNNCYSNGSYSGELAGYNQEFLARGCELLKRTRKGDLHWKIVSVYLHRSGQVMLKMKSRHVAGTITKKKKNVVLDVCKNMHAWPGRHFLEGGEQCCYFGLKTEMRGMVEFECKNQREHDMWTQGISNLLSIVAERKYRRRT